MWIWIIIAIIVIAGLFFWMKSGKNDEGMDVSSTPEVTETPQAPEMSAPSEMPSETPEYETPETPETPEYETPETPGISEDSSEDEENIM